MNFTEETAKLARNKNELHLNGQIYCKLQDFWKVNGYHEGITTYGYDDSDLYNRIEKMGATPLNFNYDSIEHIVTDDIKRSESQDLNDGHIQFIESQSEQLKFKLKKIQPPEFSENLRLFYQTQRNRLWVEDNPWLTDAKRRNQKLLKLMIMYGCVIRLKRINEIINLHNDSTQFEVFFLEEWIEHNLKLGVDTIHIYDNALTPTSKKRQTQYYEKVLLPTYEKNYINPRRCTRQIYAFV